MTDSNRERHHPSDDELLQYVDGELRSDESASLVAHLEACWRCRGRMERFEETIRRFTDFVDGPLTQRLPEPPHGWRGFAAALHRESTRESAAPRVPGAMRRLLGLPAEMWRARVLRPASAIGLLMAVVLIWLIVDVRAPRLSAAELLAASRTTERAWVARPEVIVHRTLSFEERRLPDRRVIRKQRVDVWQHGARGLTVRRVYDAGDAIIGGEWIDRAEARTLYQPGLPPVSSALDARVVMSEPDQAWRLELSAATFSAVAPAGETRVSRAGDRIILQWEGDASSGITRAELTLAGKELRPVAQTMTVRASDAWLREFRFEEVAFAELSVRDVPAARFGPDSELLPVDRGRVAAHVAIAPIAPAAGSAATPTKAALDALELDAWYRAHLLGLVFGSDVHVSQTSGGRVQMQLRVANEFRRAALMARLEPWAAQPLARLTVDATADDGARSDGRDADAIAEAPLFQALQAHLVNELPGDAATAVARESVTASETALARHRAYVAAIRAFITRWPVGLIERSSADEVTHWATVIRGHALSLGEIAAHLRTTVLRPLMTPASCASTDPVSTLSQIDTAVTRLLQTADALDARLDDELGASSQYSLPSPGLSDALCEVESAARAFAGPWSFTR